MAALVLTCRTHLHKSLTPRWAGPCLGVFRARAKCLRRKTGPVAPLSDAADAMHALLVERADELMGCAENSPEGAELACIVDAIEAYEALRWPLGKIPGGKG